MKQSAIKKILIIRLSAIGDVVMSSGLVPAIKVKYPDAKVAWLVEPMAANLLSENPLLDEVILWPRAEWRRLWKAKKYGQWLKSVYLFIRMLRAHKFDIALDAQGLLKSGIWAWFSGAKHRVGLRSKEGSQHLMTQVIEAPADGKRISSEYLLLAESQNFDTEQFNMYLPVSKATCTGVDELLLEYGVSQEKGFIAVCPFTTRPQKHWIEQHWLDWFKLASQTGLDIVMLGGPGDFENAERICNAADVNVVNLCGKTQLLQAVSVIDKATLLVGVDTGLTHVGIAQNTPTIALFGSTCPYLETTRENAVVMYDNMPCSPCRRRPTCDGDFTCLRDLTPERLWQQALALLPNLLTNTANKL